MHQNVLFLSSTPSQQRRAPHLVYEESSISDSLLDQKEVDSWRDKMYLHNDQTVFVAQPSMKWKAKSRQSLPAQYQLAESVALVESIPRWKVVEKTVFNVRNPDSKFVFGKGNLHELTILVKKSHASLIFLSIDRLTFEQIRSLSEHWGRQVYDRYTLVLQIFHANAKTKAAKLQTTLAELELIRFKQDDRMMFHSREKKIKKALEQLAKQREILSRRRTDQEIPIVAVVGYTNAGKTALIRSLAEDVTPLHPENRLFATLDVTLHSMKLPCDLQILLVDTVGFISDLPVRLFDAFRATLQSALDAELIVHVVDTSNPAYPVQINVVQETLEALQVRSDMLQHIIKVFNKMDLISSDNQTQHPGLPYSAKTGAGSNELRLLIEEKLLALTKRQTIEFRVRQGDTAQLKWLNDHGCVTRRDVSSDPEFLNVHVILTPSTLAKYRSLFG